MQKKEDETGFLRLEVSVKVTSAGDSLRVTISLKIISSNSSFSQNQGRKTY